MAGLTHYGTLGVARTASRDTIREAYYRAAAQAHPDRGGDAVAMASLAAAWAVLRDASSRASYDKALRAFGTLCTRCAGRGVLVSHKGFGKRSETLCAACSGEGITALPVSQGAPIVMKGVVRGRRK